MITPTNRFEIIYQALQELQPEIAALRSRSETLMPSLMQVFDDLGPLPPESLFLGIASDELPVLLNLHDPSPGALLVSADPGVGKTNLLRMIAGGICRLHSPNQVKFGVISNYPDEWHGFQHLHNCMGIFPTYHNSSQEFILSLTSWAHANQRGEQILILLVDDLESMTHLDDEARDDLRWLLMRGPSRRVWPILTQNAERAGEISAWLDYFRTRIFGQIRDHQTADSLSGLTKTNLSNLRAGTQFALRDGRNWLKFWIPTLD